MNLKALLIITFVAVAVLVSFKIFWDRSSRESKSAASEPAPYDEAVASTPTPAKFVQIRPVILENPNYHEIYIDALGYREIRVFASLAGTDSTAPPIPRDAVLKVGFMHELVGMGMRYSATTFDQKVTPGLQAWVTEKIYGKKVRLYVDADNMPNGKYTLQLSYYLLP